MKPSRYSVYFDTDCDYSVNQVRLDDQPSVALRRLLSSLVDVALMKEHRQAQVNSYLGRRLQDRGISPRSVF